MAILFLIITILAFVNIQPDTFFSGWDTMHSEFNPGLDLKRTIFAVWQEYRGTGLTDGMAHAADLVRQILAYPLYLILPTDLVRYVVHIIILMVGTLGIYALIKYFLKEKPEPVAQIAATLSGLFYLLNFGTIQYFYVPLESFTYFWGALPWLVYVFLRFIDNPNKKNLLIFALVNILATPSFYIPTIFVVYSLILASFLFIHLLSNRTVSTVKNSIVILITVFIMNSFWLLPFGYFLTSSVHFPREGKINVMSSEVTSLMNQKRASVMDFILLRGYYYDVQEQENFMMQTWRDHLETPMIQYVVFGLFFISIFGIFFKNKDAKYVYPLLVLTSIVFLSDHEPFSSIHEIFSAVSPFFSQVFRSPFTKLIVPLILVRTIFFAFGATMIATHINKLAKQRGISLFFVVISMCILLYAQPAFSGDLFSAKLTTKIPQEYFSLFEFFEKQDSAERIATLPQHTYWGWVYHVWGYTGSGFIWWGLPQSTMDRAFDVWNRNNENYYWEISKAIYSDDSALFASVLKKYSITWIVLDESVSSFYATNRVLSTSTLKSILADNSLYEKSAQFGFISVYKFKKNTDTKYIESITKALNIGPTSTYTDDDQAFLQNGTYITETDNFNVVYPFRSLFTQGFVSDEQFSENENQLFVTKVLNLVNSPATLVVPKSESNSTALVSIQSNGQTISNHNVTLHEETSIPLQTVGENTQITVAMPKIFEYESSKDPQFSYLNNTCPVNTNKNILAQAYFDPGNKQFEITVKNGRFCKNISLSSLSHEYAYVIKVSSQNNHGLPLKLKVENSVNRRVDYEVFLPKGDTSQVSYHLIPPMKEDGLGYYLTFESDPITGEASNIIKDIEVIKIPYDTLKNIKISAQSESSREYESISIINVEHPNSSFYNVAFDTKDGLITNDVLINQYQSFDTGWIGFVKINNFPFFKPVTKHVLINNWANGWVIDKNDIKMAKGNNLYLLYWPQLLEFLGVILVGGFFLYQGFIRSKFYEK